MKNFPTPDVKAQRWANILGHCPGVKAIFLSGSVAQGRAHKTSDIDFFIIARSGQIWTARFFVFLVLKLSGQMRSEQNHEQKICPNHFITHQSLEIREKDAYSAHLFAHNRPLYDPENIYACFVEANKDWVARFDQTFPQTSLDQNLAPNAPSPPGMLWRMLERLLKKLQRWKIQRNPEFSLPGAKIVLEDNELRFHPKPKNKDWPK